MFIQQPVRIVARPTLRQTSGVLIDTLLRQHYTTKMKTLTNPRVSVLRVETLNPVLVGMDTQLDLLVSVEVGSFDDFEDFIHSFVSRETTDDFEIQTVSYGGF